MLFAKPIILRNQYLAKKRHGSRLIISTGYTNPLAINGETASTSSGHVSAHQINLVELEEEEEEHVS